MNARASSGQHRQRQPSGSGSHFFLDHLQHYEQQTTAALLREIPNDGAPYLYGLAQVYPKRKGKGLRAALCLAACKALGGTEARAHKTALAIELFHNAFLIHDDVQDASELRRGGPTLQAEYGPSIAINVGNATNLLALRCLKDNRDLLGHQVAWLVMNETERMLTQSLEGQALELAWIRDNVCTLNERDYLHMCLKKTSWYSFIYPLRAGALIARARKLDDDRFCRFGWYLGAAFQIQDDILNLRGDTVRYGKERLGDLYEGKRTLILIHLLSQCSASERAEIKQLLRAPRYARTHSEMKWLYDLMERYGSIDQASRCARHLAGAALLEGLESLRNVPDSNDKCFILEAVRFAVHRDH